MKRGTYPFAIFRDCSSCSTLYSQGRREALAAVQERWDWSQFNSCLEDMSHLEDTELEYRRRNFTAEKERTRDV
jgi:hypothetical protein